MRSPGSHLRRVSIFYVTLPRLDEEYQTELERLNLTISEILNSDQAHLGISIRGKPLGRILPQLLVRARLRSFQRRIYGQLDDARHLLLLPTDSQEVDQVGGANHE